MTKTETSVSYVNLRVPTNIKKLAEAFCKDYPDIAVDLTDLFRSAGYTVLRQYGYFPKPTHSIQVRDGNYYTQTPEDTQDKDEGAR